MDYDIAEHFQEEISLLFDEFLHSMSESGAKVVVTSIKHTSYCTVTVKLWRCRYCLDFERLFITYFTITQWSDVRYLSLYLDHLKKLWRFYKPSDCWSD